MDELRLPAVAARLVAWHNRHPLARRITASQVHAIGYVAVPCVGQGATPPTLDEVVDGGGSLRERAQARARQPEGAPPELLPDRSTLKPDFSEDFIDPLSSRQVARFALRCGRALTRPPADGPLRQVRADGAHPGRAVVPVYLLTAVIETGTRKSRVLLGAGEQAEVLGYRIFSTPRLASVAAPLAVLTGASFMLLRPAAPPPVVVVQAAAPAALASAPLSSPHSSPPLSPGAPPASSAAASASSAAQAEAAPPLDVEPRLGRIELPDVRAQLTGEHRDMAYRSPRRPPRPPTEAPVPAPAPATDPATDPALGPAPGPVPAPMAAPVPADAHAHSRTAAPVPTPVVEAPAPAPRVKPALPPAAGAAYAVSTRPLRTRAEADQVRVAMVALLKTVAADEVHVDVLPEGDDWRVVGLPFANRAAADKARGLLVSRGMRVEVLGF